MKSAPPPPVDRIERTVNPIALAILVVCLAGALLALWLAPSAIGASLLTWMIVILAVCGAFGLLLFAFGLLQFPTRAARLDTTKAIADSSPDGILVTDRESRIVYANEAYRALSGARAAGDLRPVERLFTGSPDVSESVYRLSQAAKSGARASEELRLSPPPSGEGEVAWYRIRVRPLEGVAKDGMMAWTVSDETREHDRHETFFQDLQHAIDYLDHAPAGFFSAEPDGAIAHMNATLAGWLDYDLAQFGVGRLKIDDIVAGDGGAMLAMMSGGPGDVTTQQFDVDLKPRQGRVLPVRILHKVAFSSDGAPGPSRSLVHQSRARRHQGRGPARGGSALCAHLQFDAGGDRRGRRRGRGAASQRRLRAARPDGAQDRRRQGTAVDLRPGRRARSRRLERVDRGGRPGQGRDRAARRVARRRRAPRVRRASSSRPPIRRATRARARPSSRSTPPNSARCRRTSPRARRCRRSASSPAASRTTSTTC